MAESDRKLLYLHFLLITNQNTIIIFCGHSFSIAAVVCADGSLCGCRMMRGGCFRDGPHRGSACIYISRWSCGLTISLTMKLLLCLLLPALTLAAPGILNDRHYKICVPEDTLVSCHEMAAKSELRMTCVAGRDRLDCLKKIQSREADFEAVDPEDMYIASKFPVQDFSVIKEIRTMEEPDEEFRYEAVAVIHKDQDITSVQGLRGLKSCHTGVGRNVGYKIPITKLTKMGVLGPLNDPTLTARENELKGLSQLFSKGCLVGKWSPDAAINQRLKSTYSNLCELCEHPDVCDYPDNFSGYDGALRCLTKNGGEVAWTKVYYVKKHFGLPIGSAEPTVAVDDPANYAYFCPDGTKAPITGKPCMWAARPWQGYMTNGDTVSSFADLRAQIALAATEGAATHAEWLSKVLALSNKTVAVDNKEPISPHDHLTNAQYLDVIERDSGSPRHPVRFCVVSDTEKEKCLALRSAAFSRDIRPLFDCVQEASMDKCLKTIRDDGADIITLDGGEVYTAKKEYNMKPIIAEKYGDLGGLYYALAVVKKSSIYQSLEDLRGAKSCHTGYGRTAGWNVPLYTLIKKNLIKKDSCPYTKAMADFFSGGSCVPGVLESENNPHGDNPASLCDLCVGNPDTGDTAHKCASSADEAHYGYSGAFRCLATGSGDVAFVKHTTVAENTDGHNTAAWAANLKSADYELLCPDGGRKPVDQYATCHLAKVPPHMVVTSNGKDGHDLDDIKQAVLGAGNLYGRRPDLFKLFGSYEGKKDLLFKDSATGLETIQGQSEEQQKYDEILETIEACENQ